MCETRNSSLLGKITSLIIPAVLLFVYITDSAKAAITDVEITPDEPTIEDIIIIDTSGTEGSGPVAVIDSFVNITGTEIGLDLILEVGPYAVITPWSYSEDIGILPAGMYDLTVRIIVYSVVTDTYFKTFQVVPAPAMTLDGSGTQEEPWLIKSLEDFNDFAADANYWDDYTRLETDVNLAGMVYTTAVIAPDTNNSEIWFQGTAFTGVFDGNDHKIINMTINGGANDHLGLFGFIGEYGEIRNLGLEDACISGTGDFIGGLVGYNRYSVSNCYSTASVRGNGYSVGGLVGLNNSTISDCYSTGDVNGTSSVGGLVGLNVKPPPHYGFDRSLSTCYSTGDVMGDYTIGGLVGYDLDGTISNCYSTGDVSGEGDVGGLAGFSLLGNFSNCHSTGNVNGSDHVGGLIGYIDIRVEISNCFWDTDTQTHGVTESIGFNYGGTVTNVAGLPTAQMQTISTFTDAGWDFINFWDIGENQTYPHLRIYLPSDINKDGIVNFLDFAITTNKWLEGD
jgi:hypothetical protein